MRRRKELYYLDFYLKVRQKISVFLCLDESIETRDGCAASQHSISAQLESMTGIT